MLRTKIGLFFIGYLSFSLYAVTPFISVTAKNQLASSLIRNQEATAFYEVSLSPYVPAPKFPKLAVIGGIPSGVTQLTAISGQPCGQVMPVCQKPSFSLQPGAKCCLIYQLSGTNM
ncbi:MAG: hypothetical protein PSV35_10570, partial [bacterium]|nr:hypothetical protein [bacterium]